MGFGYLKLGARFISWDGGIHKIAGFAIFVVRLYEGERSAFRPVPAFDQEAFLWVVADLAVENDP